MSDKIELLKQMQEVGHRIGTNAVKDFLDSHGIEVNNLELSFYVKDKSKVKWKSNAKFIKLFTVEMKRIMDKKLIDIEMLGFITYLSGCLDYEDNSLRNEDGTYLTQKDIIRMTGWGRTKVTSVINELLKHELLHKKQLDNDKRKSKYYLNPNLFFKGQNIDHEIKEYYDEKKKKGSEIRT